MDRRLGRETRSSLAFSLVVEALHAYREKRDPILPNSRIQQMLRSYDDEVRAHAAGAIEQYVSDLAKNDIQDGYASTAAEIARSVVVPFFRVVWPQERSLTMPGISRELSRLPASADDAFDDAVEAIERFLVPFDGWSMFDYGLDTADEQLEKFSTINSEPKGFAFLKLLDLTIGTDDNAVVPHDLGDVLDRIRNVSACADPYSCIQTPFSCGSTVDFH